MLASVYWIVHPASAVPALWGRLTRTIDRAVAVEAVRRGDEPDQQIRHVSESVSV